MEESYDLRVVRGRCTLESSHCRARDEKGALRCARLVRQCLNGFDGPPGPVLAAAEQHAARFLGRHCADRLPNHHARRGTDYNLFSHRHLKMSANWRERQLEVETDREISATGRALREWHPG